MFERRYEKLLPFPKFLGRLRKTFLLVLGLVSSALAVGVAGYHWIAKLPWIDSLLNASMILTGMGPIDPMKTAGAKLFASAYALFSGIVFLSSAGMLFAPIFHRFLHRFHLEQATKSDSGKS